jgi:hypothetical protein
LPLRMSGRNKINLNQKKSYKVATKLLSHSLVPLFYVYFIILTFLSCCFCWFTSVSEICFQVFDLTSCHCVISFVCCTTSKKHYFLDVTIERAPKNYFQYVCINFIPDIRQTLISALCCWFFSCSFRVLFLFFFFSLRFFCLLMELRS